MVPTGRPGCARTCENGSDGDLLLTDAHRGAGVRKSSGAPKPNLSDAMDGGALVSIGLL